MKKLYFIAIMIGLASLAGCGGGGGGGTAAATAPATPYSPNICTSGGTSGSVGNLPHATPNTGTMTVQVSDNNLQPIAGEIVQLDNNTTGTLTTDIYGKAVFTGIAPGPHDVHVFDPFSWQSVYQVDSDFVPINGTRFTAGAYSYVGLSGSLSNFNLQADPYQQLDLMLLTPAGQAEQGFIVAHLTGGGTYSATLILPGVAVGSTITGDLYAMETSVPNGDNSSITTIDGVLVAANVTFTTVDAATAGASPVVQNIAMNAVKPAANVQTTIASLIPPAGLSANMVALKGSIFGSALLAGAVITRPSLTPPFDLAYYDPINPGSSLVFANDVANNWGYLSRISNCPTLNIQSVFRSAPVIAANQAGPTIAVTPATASAPLSGTQLRIQATTGGKRWDIYVPPTLSSITLPTIPAGITPILNPANPHTISAQAFQINGMGYNDFARNIPNSTNLLDFPFPMEGLASPAVPYTP